MRRTEASPRIEPAPSPPARSPLSAHVEPLKLEHAARAPVAELTLGAPILCGIYGALGLGGWFEITGHAAASLV